MNIKKLIVITAITGATLFWLALDTAAGVYVMASVRIGHRLSLKECKEILRGRRLEPPKVGSTGRGRV